MLYFGLLVIFVLAVIAAFKIFKGLARMVALAAVAVVMICLVYMAEQVGSGKKIDSDPAAAAGTTTTTLDPNACRDTWVINQASNENNRWFADGVTAIKDAETPEQARQASQTWLDQVRADPDILKGAAAYFVHRQVDASTLVDGRCASRSAKALVAEIELALAKAKVTPDQAPADGYNSGVDDNGSVVASHEPGLTGDRKALKVELEDGTVVWILGRCGQIVVIVVPPVPPGPTDEKPSPTTTKVTNTTIPRVTTTTRPGSTTSTTRPPSTTTTTAPCTNCPPPTTVTTMHPIIPVNCQLNPNNAGCPTPPVGQPPQNNTTSGINTGPTPGAPVVPPTPSPVGTTPQPSTPAPAPTPSGPNSGSNSGSGTPGGSTCGTSGCSGGGPTPATPGPPPVVDDGNHTTDPGGF